MVNEKVHLNYNEFKKKSSIFLNFIFIQIFDFIKIFCTLSTSAKPYNQEHFKKNTMNISQASKQWGVSRTTIYAKIKD